MIQNTAGIVLRAIKYGETSLIATIFTGDFGVQTYLVQGVRTNKARTNRAPLFQPATLLELSAYNKPDKNLQRLRSFQLAHIYQNLQEEIIKNSVALFSIELLYRLLPQDAPLPEIFEFSFSYFKQLDALPVDEVANFPVFFIVQLSRMLGYELSGTYTAATPHLNLHEGGFSENTPLIRPFVPDEDARALAKLLEVNDFADLKNVPMNGPMRFRLLDWYLAFLHQHAQHLGPIKSLAVLQAILH